MFIEFSKAWGQDENRWNYPGGDWKFSTMTELMEFYGISSATITGKSEYYEDEKAIPCFEYMGWATKEIERLKRHWHVEYCKPHIEIYKFTN